MSARRISTTKLGQANNPEWKTVALDAAGKVVLPNGAIGFRWGRTGVADQGQWNLEAKEAHHGHDVKLKLSVLEGEGASKETAKVGFPYFGGIVSEHFPNSALTGGSSDVLVRTVPVQRIALGKNGRPARGAGRGRCSTCRSPTTAWRAACRRTGRHELRRRHAVHAGLAGAHHRHTAPRS